MSGVRPSWLVLQSSQPCTHTDNDVKTNLDKKNRRRIRHNINSDEKNGIFL